MQLRRKRDNSMASYLDWLMGLVGVGDEYVNLCGQLLRTDYIYTVGNDVNRAIEGIGLRQEYEESYGFVKELAGRECSLLEMLVELAIRCDGVMYDPGLGERPEYWFGIFLGNLKLSNYTNNRYDPGKISDICERFNYRYYNSDGRRGGLFVVTFPKADLRVTELWYQMMWWLNENQESFT